MDFLYIVLGVYVAVQAVALLLYVPRMRFWFEGLRPQKRLTAQKNARFSVVVPAREEPVGTVRTLFKSLARQTYPSDRYDICLVVARADDPAVAAAKELVPNLSICVVENQTRKAEALDGALQSILRKEDKSGSLYDAFIILDADCMPAPNFLEEMNNAASCGAEIVIPRKRCKNWESSDRANRSFYTLCSMSTYVGLDAMGNKGKCKRNYTLALCGQGMLIKESVIRRLGGYPLRSLAEDYELAVVCMRNGYRQFYYEYAEIYSEEPVSRREYNKRRLRWIKGFSQFKKAYGKEIRDMTFRRGRIRVENLHFIIGFYPVCVLFAANGALCLIGLVCSAAAAFGSLPGIGLSLTLAGLGPVVTYLQLFVYGGISLLEDRDVNKMTFRERMQFLFLSPFAMMEYAWIFMAAFRTGACEEWKPVARLHIEPAEDRSL